jgi:hypothetical protein
MVGGGNSSVLRNNDITMRRQGQEERLAALEVHPLESLSRAWLAGHNRNVAGLAFATDRRISRLLSEGRFCRGLGPQP